VRCPEIRAFLHPFLDGELDVEKNVVVLQHLELCGCCRDRFEGEKRLLVRVREGISERCPESLRARVFAACSQVSCSSEKAAPPAMPFSLGAGRRRVIPWPRVLASVATVALVFLGIDPLCWFGCRTVKAFAAEHRAHTGPLALVGASGDEVASKLAAVVGHKVESPHFCNSCCPTNCEGGEFVQKVGEGTCLLRFRRHGQVISFFQTRGVHVHPMLKGQDGLYVAREGDCSFVGWKDSNDAGDDRFCAVVADAPAVSLDELVALAALIRVQEHGAR
jgi:hypothetical protein